MFKGGTSLSKAYGIIRRFSEDVDVTYDIRALAGDLVGNRVDESGAVNAPGFLLPATKSQEKVWSKQIAVRLNAWVQTQLLPSLQQALTEQKLAATARSQGNKVFIDYTPVAPSGTGYVAPSVMLEFGGRSSGQPSAAMPVVCDAARHIAGVHFPQATPQVMRADRTFWEKATAIHVYCLQGSFRGGDRFARHWHDLARLTSAGFATTALADTALATEVAAHKSNFFAEKSAQGSPIDYHAAVTGHLQLVPAAQARSSLAADYARMVDDGLFLDDVEAFEELMQHCQRIQDAANAVRTEKTHELALTPALPQKRNE